MVGPANKPHAIDWTPVEEAAAENTVSGFKLAILEAAKLLEQRLKEERIPGSTLAEQVENARLHFTRPADVTKAAKFVTALRSGNTPALTTDQGATYIQSFRQAVADLNDLAQNRDSWQAQLRLYVGMVRGKRTWLSNILIGIGAFFVAVLLLADTTPGQLLIVGLVAIVHFLFKWVVALLIAGVLVLFAVLGTAMWLDKNRGGKIKVESDDHH